MTRPGYIKLHRTLLDWEWYDDANTKLLFLHLLLTVNFEDRLWHGVPVKRGQRVCSYRKLSEETGLSIKNVRTALEHLERTGEVARESAPGYSLLTVKSFQKYQEGADLRALPGAQEGQTAGKAGASEGQLDKKDKKEEKDKKERTPPFPPTGFLEFWAAYPKKRSRGEAERAYRKLAPGEELRGRMLEAVRRQKEGEEWRRDGGRFIPYPATWLEGRRWEDEEGPQGTNNPFLRLLREEDFCE